MTQLRQLAFFIVPVGTLISLSSCSTVPITGRSQLSMVSDEQLIASANNSFSKFIEGANSKNAILQVGESPTAASTLASVQRVSDRIINAAGLRGRREWQVVVVKSKIPNAFVMPNGKIVVFTGILPIAQNEAGLAAVIGHEVAHVVARHQAERMSQALLTQTVLTAADVALASRNQSNQPAISAALGLGAQYGVLLPFSRVHESEADHIGVIYMAKAGYDPSEAVALWERMERKTGRGPWEILSTHPSHATRQANLREWQSEAMLFYTDRNRPLPLDLSEIQQAKVTETNKAVISPIALRPSHPIGYWYSTQLKGRSTSATYRYERDETCERGECLRVAGTGASSATVTTSLGIVKIDNPDGTWTRFSPPIRQLKFPLAVGDSWFDEVTVETSNGAKRKATFKFDVVTYELVSVPAGSFAAYKIVTTINGARNRESWYSPETRTFVRVVTVDARGIESINELTAYQRSEEPVEPISGAGQ